MKIGAWFRKRGPQFVIERGCSLLERYSISPDKAIHRVEHLLTNLAEHGCHPTLFVPGMVMEQHLKAIQHLRIHGAEIGVHGYNHVDLKACSPDDASRQLGHAVQVFHRFGFQVHGFRAPYLSCSDALLAALPAGLFGYSSNKAFEWHDVLSSISPVHDRLFDTLNTFYVPSPAAATRCLPWIQDGIVEIPVAVPDDLQFLDGLGYTPDEMRHTWVDLLDATYQRGEIYNLMFHPELATLCEMPLVGLLDHAASLTPPVWVAQLHEISQWWREKAVLKVDVNEADGLILVNVEPSARATLLVRGIDGADADPWDGSYQRARSGLLRLPAQPRPLLGLASGESTEIVQFLANMGYLIDHSDTAPRCAIYLDQTTIAQFENKAAMVDYIEHAPGPLVRLWPWPNGMRSAVCITGDLDALTLVDYAARLFNR